MTNSIFEIVERLFNELISKYHDLEEHEFEAALKLLSELEISLYNINHRFCR